MTLSKVAALGLSIFALTGGAAFAQNTMMGDSHTMSDNHMMASKSDMKKMDRCKSMDHDMMMKSHTCMKMMKMHPDMMQGNGMMSPK